MLCIFCLFIGCRTNSQVTKMTEKNAPERILSLAPSITETLFALGCGSRVVGVTDYCRFPPEARTIQKIGGYLDPNFEAIIACQPDMVFLLKEDIKVQLFLQKKKVPCIVIDDGSVGAILGSIPIIGEACGRKQAADSLRDFLARELAVSPESTGPGPRVLLCVGRGGVGTGDISTIWVAGRNTWYHELLARSGMENGIGDASSHYTTLTTEGVIRLSPDIIIDVMANMSAISTDKITKDWEKLRMVPAVRDGMVFCLSEDYMTIPGPRINLVLHEFRNIIRTYKKMKERQ